MSPAQAPNQFERYETWQSITNFCWADSKHVLGMETYAGVVSRGQMAWVHHFKLDGATVGKIYMIKNMKGRSLVEGDLLTISGWDHFTKSQGSRFYEVFAEVLHDIFGSNYDTITEGCNGLFDGHEAFVENLWHIATNPDRNFPGMSQFSRELP